MEKKYGHTMDLSFFFFYKQGSRTFPSVLSITKLLRKKTIPLSFMVAFKCVFPKRDISYSVSIPVFHEITMK